MLALAPFVAPFACTHDRPTDQDDLGADFDDVDASPKASTHSASDTDAALENPEEPTAWATRNLIMTTPQPSLARINTCADQLSRIAAEAANQQDMLAAQTQVAQLTAQDLPLYHYCFYQLVVRLDDRLSAGGPVMTDMATTFFASMRELWLLARGLDYAQNHHLYFAYLQRRYVQLSREYFGRDIQVVGPAMGDVKAAGEIAPPPTRGKAAGESPAH